MYIINTIPNGKCFVRYLRTRCFCIRNLTRSLRSLVRFLIRQQLVRKYRTPALSMKYSLYICRSKITRWLNVKQRLMVNDAVMMHKCLKGPSPSYLSDNLVPTVLSYPLTLSLRRAGRREPWERGCLSDKVSTRAIVHDRQTRCICYRGVKIWNNCCRNE